MENIQNMREMAQCIFSYQPYFLKADSAITNNYDYRIELFILRSMNLSKK